MFSLRIITNKTTKILLKETTLVIATYQVALVIFGSSCRPITSFVMVGFTCEYYVQVELSSLLSVECLTVGEN